MPLIQVKFSITWKMPSLKSNPAASSVPPSGEPKFATPLMRMPGPLPERPLRERAWWRSANCTRTSFSLFDPKVETSCAAAEFIASRKSVDHSTVFGTAEFVAPTLFGASFSKRM